MKVRRSVKSDLPAILKMARKLWPDVKAADIFKTKFIFYVAEDGDRLIGFMMLSVRKDYVEGSVTSPVGYVEGIFVEKPHRKKRVARRLVQAAEAWCVKKGFTELGSDVEFRNKISQRFHSRTGFVKSDLIVHYIKKVRPNR
ncbi:MAG TPA: GNAT family N-acetyltransferase [Cyclobacteriaceae bacterium]|nr:GNAT family N-acetyltransferase [Cyclobacteriaceae bacterium]